MNRLPWSRQSATSQTPMSAWTSWLACAYLEPGREGSTLLSAVQIGATEAITLELDQGAGGKGSLPGDYLYGDHREPYRQAGLWGIFRVYSSDSQAGILPLDGR